MLHNTMHVAKTSSYILSKNGSPTPTSTRLLNQTERWCKNTGRQIKQMAFSENPPPNNLNHVSNPHPSLQAEKKDKRKQISKSQGDYFNTAGISWVFLGFFTLVNWCNESWWKRWMWALQNEIPNLLQYINCATTTAAWYSCCYPSTSLICRYP